MAREPDWTDVGAAAELSQHTCRPVKAKNAALAITFKDGEFGAVSHACNHVGGPLGDGHLDGDYVVCPWHHWKFHRVTGVGEPGFEEDCVPAFPVKVEKGRVLVDIANPQSARKSRTSRIRSPAKSSARPARCGWPAYRPRSWMPSIRAFPAPIICLSTRSPPAASSARKHG